MPKYISISLIFILIFINFSYADNINIINMQKELIYELFSKKNYFNTITETGRLIYFNKKAVKNYPDYYYFINLNYLLGKQYRTVLYNYNNIHQNYADSFSAKMLMVESYFSLGYPGHALDLLLTIDKNKLSSEKFEDYYYKKIELELHIEKYSSAYFSADKYLQKYHSDKNFIKLRNELKKYSQIKQKSIPIAVTLSSILPGSGQLYSGKYVAALTSLLAIAATSYATYYFYKKDNKELAYTSGFFCLLFYSGNIYGAYNSAKQYNKKEKKHFRENILNNSFIENYQPTDYINKELIFK